MNMIIRVAHRSLHAGMSDAELVDSEEYLGRIQEAIEEISEFMRRAKVCVPVYHKVGKALLTPKIGKIGDVLEKAIPTAKGTVDVLRNLVPLTKRLDEEYHTYLTGMDPSDSDATIGKAIQALPSFKKLDNEAKKLKPFIAPLVRTEELDYYLEGYLDWGTGVVRFLDENQPNSLEEVAFDTLIYGYTMNLAEAQSARELAGELYGE